MPPSYKIPLYITLSNFSQAFKCFKYLQTSEICINLPLRYTYLSNRIYTPGFFLISQIQLYLMT